MQAAEQTNTRHSTVLNALDALDTTVKEAKTEDEKLSVVKNLLEKRPGVSVSAQTGSDIHQTVQEYQPDEINNYFNE